MGKISPKTKNGADIYFFGCGKHFEDLRKWYRCFADICIEDYATAFIDNDVNKWGKEFYGKPVLSPDTITAENSVVVITAADYKDFSIDRQMMDKGFYWRSDLHSAYQILWVLQAWIFDNFMKLKDKHKNERCFIVGNGTSLKSEDLDMLVNEKTFAMNKVYKVFDKTLWRPSFYVVDGLALNEHWHDINKNIDCGIFTGFEYCLDAINKDPEFRLKNANYYSLFNIYTRPAEHRKPIFGEYPDMFFAGGTSAFCCFQLAVFLGFNEIYLLGMDNEYSIMISNSGEIDFSERNDHFAIEYHDKSIFKDYNRQGFAAINKDIINCAYQSAKEYADSHDIKIYNATRGGKLEIFERVNFDEIFSNQSGS
ncbi:MAG: DUF115 domain-containing protein [Oscillospiraceae bacterium]|nr:DUF115 domain-containing protein [Oscillospiraceae bacterium]